MIKESGLLEVLTENKFSMIGLSAVVDVNNIKRARYTFCYFDSFLIVSLIPFINNPDSSSDLIIFMISFISSVEIISVVKPDPNFSYEQLHLLLMLLLLTLMVLKRF